MYEIVSVALLVLKNFLILKGLSNKIVLGI